MSESFVDQENLSRTEDYRKDRTQEQFLLQMNQALSELEPRDWSGIVRPTLFIFGLPRSGTTLASQLVAHCLELGYINNLIARFWLAPVHGIQLSRAVISDRDVADFESDYGKTESVEGPHEFAYFWHHWLRLRSVDDFLRFNTGGAGIDWPALRNKLGSMQDAFQSGMMFKTMFTANFIEEFASYAPAPLFLYIERDPEDVAISILKARKKYYGSRDAWWATHPPNYAQISALPFDEQIAGQVSGLRKAYDHALSLVAKESVITVNYQDLCSNPGQWLQQICDRVAHNYGYQLGISNAPPASFPVRKQKGTENSDEKAVLAALRRGNI